MNTQLTELAFILDRSGSMQAIAADAIDGFNHFLAEQKSAPGQARLTLVLFDDEYLVPTASQPVAEVRPLDSTTYEPRNSTALLDAIARTVDELGARLAVTPEDERPGKVIVAILTDGYENASTHETWQTVSHRIRHQSAKYGWEFLFLGANQDAIATASHLGIGAKDSATFQGDGTGIRATARGVAKRSTALRARAGGHATPSEFELLARSMQEVVNEEDRSIRE